MNRYTIEAQNITKLFSRRLIFKDINFSFSDTGIFGIAGQNGSGKSTLVKIIAGLISPSSGKVIHKLNDKNINADSLHNHFGFCAPYLVLYDEFSARENLGYFSQIRGLEYDTEKVNYLLNEFLLYDRRDDAVKGYSSGMKQRLKFIFALMHSPELVILDEPTSNLDSAGKESVYRIIQSESVTSLFIIASNEENDLALCKEIIQLEKFKHPASLPASP